MPDAKATLGRAINPEGVMMGWFVDSAGTTHGFIRTPDGSITTLELPASGILDSNALGINARGDIVGSYVSEDRGGSRLSAN